jgi:hypothetical protein
VYNATSCAGCHQNPVTGGSSQINELRAGKWDGTQFVDHPGGSLIQDRAIDASIQEKVYDEYGIRAFRLSMNVLGDGYIEAIADETLVAIANSQPRFMRGLIVRVPVLEADGAERIGRFGWKNQQASLESFAADAYLNEMGVTSPLQPSEKFAVVFAGPRPVAHLPEFTVAVPRDRRFGPMRARRRSSPLPKKNSGLLPIQLV